MKMTRTSTVTRPMALLVVALLLLVGCSSGPASVAPSSDAASLPASGAALVGGVDVGAEVQVFAALDPAAQESELRTLSATVERQLMAISGLEADLGGATEADAAYAQLSGAMQKSVEQWTAQPGFGRTGGQVPAADTPSAGGLIATTVIIVAMGAEAAVGATNNVKSGKSLTDTTTQPDGAGGEKQPGSMTISGSSKEASMEAGTEVTANGVTGKIKTVITVAPCPDANGQFTATTKMTSSIAKAGATTGSNLTVEVAVTGQVDDDAQLVGQEVEIRTQSAQFASGKGQFIDVSMSWNDTGGKTTGYKGQLNRTGGAVTEEFTRDQITWSILMAQAAKDKALAAAKQGWESGRCVALDPTTSPSKRTGLKPSASVTITAAPRSKIDGAAVGGTVKGALNGDSSLDPAGSKVPADATFTYVAPDEKDKSATVSLEARSKRGVAKAELAFDTKTGGYDLNGSVETAPGGTKVTGQTCDVTEPFTAEASGDMNGTINFTPTSDVAGTLTFKGVLGSAPFKLTGKGTYTVNVPPGADAGTLDWTWSVTTYTPLGNPTGGGPVTISMTPAEGC
jgi:hypothetical protein